LSFTQQVAAQTLTTLVDEVFAANEKTLVVTTPTKYRIEIWGNGAPGVSGTNARGGGAGGFSGKEIILPAGTYYYGKVSNGGNAYFSNISTGSGAPATFSIDMKANNANGLSGGAASGGDQNVTGGNGANGTNTYGGGGGASGQWDLPAGTNLNASDQFGGTYPGRVEGGNGGNGSYTVVLPPPNPPMPFLNPAGSGINFGGGGGGNIYSGSDMSGNPFADGEGGKSGIKITSIVCNDVSSVSIAGTSNICEGKNTEFTASYLPATATNVTYQWYKDNVSIPTATTASYTATEAGIYQVEATSACNTSSPVTVTSGDKTLTVDPLPQITTEPVSATVCLGAEATFTVEGTNLGSFLWFNKTTTTPVAGETGPSLTTSTVATYLVGAYGTGACATDPNIVAISNEFSLSNSTDEVINITSEPAVSNIDCEENYLKFTVVATGTITGYQWKKDGVNIDGATTDNLEFSSLLPENSGKYVLEITGPCGTILSKEYTVVVNPINPIFNPIAPICIGDPAPVLPTVSENGMKGTWIPAVVSNTTSGTYVFSPDEGLCLGNSVNLRVTVNDCSMSVISGVVYEDADGGEIGGTPLTVSGTYISVFRMGGRSRISAVPLLVAPVTAGTGAYTFPALAAGKYKLVIGTSADGSDIPSYPNIGNFSMTAGAEGNGNGSTGDGLPDGITFVTLSVNAPFNSRSRVRVDAGIDFALKQGAPLPVRLVSFVGKNTEKGNQLTWKTSSEVNFSHFEVERSVNAKAFDKIGKVEGNKGEKYDFVDNSSIITHNSSLYYRLKMVDLDGSSAYSKIIALNTENSENTIGQIYPNPSYGEAKVRVNAIEAGDWTVKSFDISGKLTSKETIKLLKGVNEVELKKLGNGMNYIQISDGKTTEVRKVIKQ
jgi:hypothetical protein